MGFAFFVLLIDDVTRSHVDHYQTLSVWLGSHLGLVVTGRWFLTSAVVRRVQSGEWAFLTIVVGVDQDNEQFLNDLGDTPGRMGWNVLASMTESELEEDLGKLGRWLDNHELDRAVLTTSVSQQDAMLGWVAVLEGKGVEILIVPSALDYMVGTVKSSNLFGVPLVNLSNTGLQHGMQVAKRLMDIVGSVCALVLLFPILAWVAWRIRRDSPGPVLYRQERLGLHGKPFSILKFRTMVQNAEGATLS